MENLTKFLFLFIGLVLLFSFGIGEKVEGQGASRQTTFYFQQGGIPIQERVDFTINCYGSSGGLTETTTPEKLEKISQLSETCKKYGCRYDTSELFAIEWKNIGRCDIKGQVEGKKFKINNFLGDSLEELKCYSQDYDIVSDDTYYKKTLKYKECMQKVSDEFYTQEEEFICHKYLKEVPQEECNGYGYIIIDGVCNKFTEKTNKCIERKEKKEKECEKRLKDVTSQMEKTERGTAFDELCEVKVDISGNVYESQQKEPESDSFSLEGGFFKKIFNSVKGFLLNLFGDSC